jgi:hypothetical protein
MDAPPSSGESKVSITAHEQKMMGAIIVHGGEDGLEQRLGCGYGRRDLGQPINTVPKGLSDLRGSPHREYRGGRNHTIAPADSSFAQLCSDVLSTAQRHRS